MFEPMGQGIPPGTLVLLTRGAREHNFVDLGIFLSCRVSPGSLMRQQFNFVTILSSDGRVYDLICYPEIDRIEILSPTRKNPVLRGRS
jgi:hypothetical protein